MQLAAIALFAGALAGCSTAAKGPEPVSSPTPVSGPNQSSQPDGQHKPFAPGADTSHALDRSQAYYLLYELSTKESEVDGILIIKSPRKETAALIKEIAKLSKSLTEKIETDMKADPTLRAGHSPLPVAEIRTRESIEAATRNELIFGSGKDLELRLLLTQAEAMSYLCHLAKVTQGFETEPTRIEFLKGLSKQAHDLGERVVTQISTLK